MQPSGPRTAPEVCILGPVEVRVADGVTAPPSRTQRQLIAMLATAVGRTVGAERMADLLELSPGALRTAVGRVRRLLGPASVETLAGSYRLRATVDVDELERLVRDRADDAQTRLEALERARSLVRGEPLAGFRDLSWALPAVARLDELVCLVAEERGAALLALDRPGEAVAAMDELVLRHPLRDRARALLMEAYAADGRHADALRAYRDYHRLLADELGTVPSPTVRQLERRITAEMGELPDDEAPTATEADAPASRHPALRSYRSSFVGRTRDVLALAAELSDHRVVTVTGPPGVGKTRLASGVAAALVEAGARVWFVELAAVHHDGEVRGVVTDHVGSHDTGTHDPVELLGRHGGTLVLDNAEHVLSEVSALADEVSRRCPDVRVLVTSRERLGIDGERVHALEPLDPRRAGRELFEHRAAEAGAPTEHVDRALVSEICARVDGLPLAIEIVATLAAPLGLRALRDELHHGLGFLDVPGPRTTDRHQTLNAAIAWSYRLLDADQQRALRTLAVFPSGFETDAATHVLAAVGLPRRRVVALLSGLVDRSLVVGVGTSASGRMHLLETIRAFGVAELEREGELVRARDALASWVTTLTGAECRDLHDRDCHERSVRLERDVPAWRAAASHAVDTSDPRLAARLCGAAAQLLLLARPDLAAQVQALDGIGEPDERRRSALAAVTWAVGMRRHDETILEHAISLLDGVDAADTSGLRRYLCSAHLILLTDDEPRATAMRLELADDDAVPTGMRDQTVANALYGICVAGADPDPPPALVARVREVAGRTRVPATRQLAHLALSWATAASDPARSEEHLDLALAEKATAPLVLRRIWSASVSRAMIASDPRRAASRLVDLLGEDHPDDTTLFVTAAALLAGVDHPCADDAAASVNARWASTNLARSIADVETRVQRGRVVHGAELVSLLRGALVEVRDGVTAPA